MRKLVDNEVAEFEPATSVSVVFSDGEIFTFREVVRATKASNGSLFLELKDESFTEVTAPYRFYQIGSEIERD